MDSAMSTVAGCMPSQMNRSPTKTMPGMGLNTESTGSTNLDSLGLRESRMPNTTPRIRPNSTETKVKARWVKMAWGRSW